ncbi:unnamed protein product [Somion occarium]|uniref:Uncharacterized protein n=1 Tax=Somion occarium TaxID=3059160 RepID=A0ABP1D0N5_9APHY
MTSSPYRKSLLKPSKRGCNDPKHARVRHHLTSTTTLLPEQHLSLPSFQEIPNQCNSLVFSFHALPAQHGFLPHLQTFEYFQSRLHNSER